MGACARCRNHGHYRSTCQVLLVATRAELETCYPPDVTPEQLAADGLRLPGSPDTCHACTGPAHRGACRPPQPLRPSPGPKGRIRRARKKKADKEPEDWRVRFWRLESRQG